MSCIAPLSPMEKIGCEGAETASRCSRRYVPTYRHLRRDVAGGASGRSFGEVG